MGRAARSSSARWPISSRSRSRCWCRDPPSANELLRSNADQPHFPLPWIRTLVEKGQQQPHRLGVQSFLARQVIAWGVRPVERHEVGEAHGHSDRAERSKSVTVDPREDASGELASALEDEAGFERVDLERLLLTDRLRLPFVRDRTLGEAPRLGMKSFAPA